MLRAPLRTGLRVPVVLALVLLTACGDDTTQAGPSATTSSPTPTVNLPLEVTPWRLTTLPGGSAVAESVAASARFDGRTVSGSGGCNSYSAGYTVDGESLTVDAARSTLMACEGPAMETEAAFLPALEKVAGYRTTGATLTLVDGDETALLVFEQTDPFQLTGTTWQAMSVTRGDNGKEAAQSLVSGTEVTAVFDADGKVSGNGGCNRYSGPYWAVGGSLSIGPLAATKKVCAEPAGVTEQESAFIAAMEATTTYRIVGTSVGSTVELRDDDGALQVTFKAAP